MAKLPLLPARDILKALGKAGFVIVSQRGSHIKLRGQRAGVERTVIVPNYDEVPRGVSSSGTGKTGDPFQPPGVPSSVAFHCDIGIQKSGAAPSAGAPGDLPASGWNVKYRVDAWFHLTAGAVAALSIVVWTRNFAVPPGSPLRATRLPPGHFFVIQGAQYQMLIERTSLGRLPPLFAGERCRAPWGI